MRAAYRVVRAFAGFALLALSVGWLLRRRRAAAGPPATGRWLTVVPPVSGLDEPARVEPRAPEPLTAIGRPVHDAAVAEESTPAVAVAKSPAEPVAEPVPEPVAEPGTGAVAESSAEPGTGAAESPNGLAAAPADDLREIRGIGPATESALHDLGIHTYRQLAVLDAEGMEQLRVALKDTQRRIERQDWVSQAAELHRAKYGGDPLRPV